MQSADCVPCSLQTAYLAPCSLQTAQVLRLHATDPLTTKEPHFSPVSSKCFAFGLEWALQAINWESFRCPLYVIATHVPSMNTMVGNVANRTKSFRVQW